MDLQFNIYSEQYILETFHENFIYFIYFQGFCLEIYWEEEARFEARTKRVYSTYKCTDCIFLMSEYWL